MNAKRVTNLLGVLAIIMLALIVVILLGACNSRPSDTECKNAWLQMESGIDPLEYDTYDEYVEAFEAEVGMIASMILNREHAPDTVGYVLKECIQNGWDYRAASGLDQ